MKDRVSITMLEGGIADVRLIRADKMNALDPAMFQGIAAAAKELASAKTVRVVLLSGEGRSFCAGLDMASFTASTNPASTNPESTNPGGGDSSKSKLTARTHGNTNIFQHVAMVWRQLPMPVIAAVHGVCFGGGLQIISGADIRIVAPDARLAIMEMRWGLIPDMGGYALWRSLVRGDVLRELTYTNREFSGEEALNLGFATHVDAAPYARALALAKVIASRNPQAVRAAKRISNRLPDLDEDAILMAESEEQMHVIRSPNQIEAVRANIEKRAPDFAD